MLRKGIWVFIVITIITSNFCYSFPVTSSADGGRERDEEKGRRAGQTWRDYELQETPEKGDGLS